MKKSLIALAVMAAAGAASAQSSVTVYGIMDLNVGTCKNSLGFSSYGCISDANTAVKSQNGVNSGGLSTSRWGLKGTEDLGGGTKAYFQLEQGLYADKGDSTATTAGTQFDRISIVGLSGDFGAVQLGRNWGPFDVFHDAVNAVGNMNMSPTDAVNKAAGGDYTSNHDQHGAVQHAGLGWCVGLYRYEAG
jgi:predicted porin